MRKIAAQHHAALAAVLALAAACSTSDPDRCDLATDCPSGYCRADHTCAPVDEADAGTDGPPGADGPLGCQPDHDGTLTRAELPMMAGQTARFRIATDATVDTAGQQGSGGQRTWTLAGGLPGSRTMDVLRLCTTSNVGEPGVWRIRARGTAIVPVCGNFFVDRDETSVRRLALGGALAACAVGLHGAGRRWTERVAAMLVLVTFVPAFALALTASPGGGVVLTLTGGASGNGDGTGRQL